MNEEGNSEKDEEENGQYDVKKESSEELED